jgi:radical SAM PhpK family P-methyltransferase
MEKIIDCFFIGHNEMDFVEYEKEVGKMGTHSGAYRDLNLNFIQYNNKPYSASDIFNLFYLNGSRSTGDLKPLRLGETFSAAIAYLGTYLHRRGLSFDYVNSFRDDREELVEKLQRGNILTIAIITTLYVSVLPILEIMDFIKKYDNTARIIVGGPFVSTQCRKMDPVSLAYLFQSIDADFYVNSSQGEAALVKIINALKNGLPLDNINNIYYKTNNRYAAAPVLEENNRLSENMVDWRLFSPGVGEYASVRTAVSCPFSCAFCGFPQHAGKYQVVEVGAVEKELTQLAAPDTVKSVGFIDDTFNVPVSRFKEILRMMIKNNYRFRWNSHFRCQFADRETVELMKASGCEGVFLGIESGSDRMLKNMNKGVNIQQYYKGAALLKEYGILTYGSFIIGFPGETDETVQETIQFIKESGLDYYRAQLWYCDTITPIWEKREEKRITGSHFEWAHETMDSQEACDRVDEIFQSIENPVWVPQYNFECDGLFHLIHRGFTPEEINDFLKNFNNGIRDKLAKPSRKEIGFEAVMQLKKVCARESVSGDAAVDETVKIDRASVSFDF